LAGFWFVKGVAVAIENGEEDLHILEAGVHTLAKEGDHCVRGIADNNARRANVVWITL
jgi:hypothetical protein